VHLLPNFYSWSSRCGPAWSRSAVAELAPDPGTLTDPDPGTLTDPDPGTLTDGQLILYVDWLANRVDDEVLDTAFEELGRKIHDEASQYGQGDMEAEIAHLRSIFSSRGGEDGPLAGQRFRLGRALQASGITEAEQRASSKAELNVRSVEGLRHAPC
jgi:hypothetical protein